MSINCSGHKLFSWQHNQRKSKKSEWHSDSSFPLMRVDFIPATEASFDWFVQITVSISIYYVSNHFNQLSARNKGSFSVFNLNIRGIKQNLDKLTDLLCTLDRDLFTSWWYHQHNDTTTMMTSSVWWYHQFDDTTNMMISSVRWYHQCDETTSMMIPPVWWYHQYDDTISVIIPSVWWYHQYNDSISVMIPPVWWYRQYGDTTSMDGYDLVYNSRIGRLVVLLESLLMIFLTIETISSILFEETAVAHRPPSSNISEFCNLYL